LAEINVNDLPVPKDFTRCSYYLSRGWKRIFSG